MSTKHPVPFRIEHALRERLLGAGRHEVAQSIGWDASKHQDAIDHKIDMLRRAIHGIRLAVV